MQLLEGPYDAVLATYAGSSRTTGTTRSACS